MDFLQILVLALYITQVLTKSRSRKHKESSSEEGSIENLLYYKDCQRNRPETTHAPEPLRHEVPITTPAPPRQPECPFPKMCCALTCGNECGSNQPAMRMHGEPSNIQPNQYTPGMEAIQPPLVQRRKKRIRPHPNNMQSLIPTRRDYSGFTKEKIKGLIAQDDDIRKILKDLVRVTMQKVDLQNMLNSNQKKSYNDVYTVRSVLSTVYDMDDYIE